MYKETKDLTIDSVENMRGGEGVIQIKKICNEADLNDKGRFIAHVTVPVDGSIGYHVHENETEIYYFLKGNAEVNDNGTTVKVSAGDTIITPDGCGHDVKNIGTEPVELMAIIVYK